HSRHHPRRLGTAGAGCRTGTPGHCRLRYRRLVPAWRPWFDPRRVPRRDADLHYHRRAAADAGARLLSRHVHRHAHRGGLDLQSRPRSPGSRVMSLLALHNINKTFGPLKALTDLSFEVGHSEVVGLLGDNGAGKSTTVNMLS